MASPTVILFCHCEGISVKVERTNFISQFVSLIWNLYACSLVPSAEVLGQPVYKSPKVNIK